MDAGNKQLLSALLAQLETKDKQIEILLSTNAELVQEIKRVVSEKDAILAGKLPTTVIASSAANGKSPTPKASAQPTQSTPASLSAEAPKPKQKAPQKSQQTTTAKPNATVNGSTEDLEGAEAPKRKGKRKVSDLAADSSPKVAPQLALEVKQDAAQSKQPAKKKKKGSETQTKAPIPVDAYDLLFRLHDSMLIFCTEIRLRNNPSPRTADSHGPIPQWALDPQQHQARR